MSLFKGFSVVGLASERSFLENTKLCSGPAARAVCAGTGGLGADLDAGAGMGLGLTAARAVCHCARESRSTSRAHWGHRLNNLRALNKFSFLFFFSAFKWANSYTQSLSVWLSGKIECWEDNETLHYYRVIQSWGGCLGWRTPNYAWLVNTHSYIMFTECHFMFNSYSTRL